MVTGQQSQINYIRKNKDILKKRCRDYYNRNKKKVEKVNNDRRKYIKECLKNSNDISYLLNAYDRGEV